MTQAIATLSEADQAALVPVQARPPARPEDRWPPPVVLQTMYHLAKAAPMAAGVAVPKGINNPGKALMVMVAGYELGLGPMAALRHIVAINGRTEPDAQLMMGIVMANDPTARFEFREITTARAHVVLSRQGRVVCSAEYTVADAERAGQLPAMERKVKSWGENNRPIYERDAEGNIVMEESPSAPWNTHRHLMLAYNAVRTCCKLGAPDLINAITPFMAGVGEFVEEATYEEAADAFAAVGSLLEGDPEFDLEEAPASARQQASSRADAPGRPAEPPPMAEGRQAVYNAVTGAIRAGRVTGRQIAAVAGDTRASAVEVYMREHGVEVEEVIARAAAIDLSTGEVRDA